MITKKSHIKRDSTEMATLYTESSRLDNINVHNSAVKKYVGCRNHTKRKENQAWLNERSIDKVSQALVKRPIVQ
jgi:hypothetical protein